jgi:hypothetical protein
MAFIATTRTPDEAYVKIKGLMHQIKLAADRKAAQFGSGGLSNEVLEVLDSLVTARNELDSVEAIPGIVQYARDVENDQSYNVGAEFTSVKNAVQAAIDEIVATYPVSANGYVEEFNIGLDGARVYRLFTAQQLSGVVTALQSISASIV